MINLNKIFHKTKTPSAVPQSTSPSPAADTSTAEVIKNVMRGLPKHVFSLPDDVGATTTLEVSLGGPCLPTADTEGSGVMLLVETETMENNEPLPWLRDDTQIEGLVSAHTPEVTTPAFLVDVLEEEETSTKAKTEALSTAEKYWRLR